jgi:hypothetical protein
MTSGHAADRYQNPSFDHTSKDSPWSIVKADLMHNRRTASPPVWKVSSFVVLPKYIDITQRVQARFVFSRRGWLVVVFYSTCVFNLRSTRYVTIDLVSSTSWLSSAHVGAWIGKILTLVVKECGSYSSVYLVSPLYVNLDSYSKFLPEVASGRHIGDRSV